MSSGAWTHGASFRINAAVFSEIINDAGGGNRVPLVRVSHQVFNGYVWLYLLMVALATAFSWYCYRLHQYCNRKDPFGIEKDAETTMLCYNKSKYSSF